MQASATPQNSVNKDVEGTDQETQRRRCEWSTSRAGMIFGKHGHSNSSTASTTSYCRGVVRRQTASYSYINKVYHEYEGSSTSPKLEHESLLNLVVPNDLLPCGRCGYECQVPYFKRWAQ